MSQIIEPAWLKFEEIAIPKDGSVTEEQRIEYRQIFYAAFAAGALEPMNVCGKIRTEFSLFMDVINGIELNKKNLVTEVKN